MRLTVTPEAIEKLKRNAMTSYRYLVLWYDTDGCGCGVNGVPTIRYINKKPPNYLEVENELYPTLIHKQQAAFFAVDMKLDFANGTFRLSSPEGILNPFISQQSIGEINEEAGT